MGSGDFSSLPGDTQLVCHSHISNADLSNPRLRLQNPLHLPALNNCDDHLAPESFIPTALFYKISLSYPEG